MRLQVGHRAAEVGDGTDFDLRAVVQNRAGLCEPHREAIEVALTHGRNAMSIWQSLVDDHGFKGSYLSVRRFVARQRGTADSPQARCVIVTGPGEEGQVAVTRAVLPARSVASRTMV